MSARMSPDGLYYWDGVQWLTTVSHDGRFRWDGRQWVPLHAGPYMPAAVQPRPPRRPTSWTQPLQYAVCGWYAISGLYALSLPFWMSGPMTQAMNLSIQRQQSLYPSVTPPPPGLTDAMTSMMSFFLWVGALIGLAICVVAIVAALNRWTWGFYAILALLGLGMVALPIDIFDLFAGNALANAYGGYTLPAWTYIAGAVAGVVSIGLFIWMLVAAIKRGPWAMTRGAA